MRSDKGMQMGSICCPPCESPDPDSFCDATLYTTALFGLQRESPTFSTSTSRVGSNRGVPTMAAFIDDPTPMSFFHLGWLVRFLTGSDSGRVGRKKGLRDISTRHSRGIPWENKAKVGRVIRCSIKEPGKASDSLELVKLTLALHSSSSKQGKLA